MEDHTLSTAEVAKHKQRTQWSAVFNL